MSLETGLTTYLLDQTDITDLIEGRIYPLILPQKPTYPAITYEIDSLRDGFTLESGQTGIVTADLQIDAWGRSQSLAAELAALIVNALQNLKGDMGGTTVQGMFRDTHVDIFESSVNAYRRSVSFTCWHSE